jgi:hypothetical protein
MYLKHIHPIQSPAPLSLLMNDSRDQLRWVCERHDLLTSLRTTTMSCVIVALTNCFPPSTLCVGKAILVHDVPICSIGCVLAFDNAAAPFHAQQTKSKPILAPSNRRDQRFRVARSRSRLATHRRSVTSAETNVMEDCTTSAEGEMCQK